MISKQSYIGSISLALLVLVTSWVAVINSRLNPIRNIAKVVTGKAQNITVLQMNNLGRPSYQAVVKQANQFGNGDVIFHDINAITFPADQSSPWHLSADHGRSTDNNQQVYFWGHVTAYRPKSANNAAFLFKTTTLTVYPQQNFAETDDPVTLSEPGTKNVTTGIGMRAYSKPQKIIHLLSDVHSTYEPNEKTEKLATQPS